MWTERQERVEVSAAFDVIAAGDVDAGALALARRLRREGLRVGLAGNATDDPASRASVEKARAERVDVGGVRLIDGQALRVIDGRGGVATSDAREVPLSPLEQQAREDLTGVSIPSGWSASLLALSGVNPSVEASASFCKAARAARRAGSLVLLDPNVRWTLWRGRDARLVLMALRDADAVWCTAEDLFGLNLDLDTLRSALRSDAVLVTLDGEGRLAASGAFGVVRPALDALPPVGESGWFTAGIAAALVKRGRPMLLEPEPWLEALRRAHALASARR
ncbi:MAG: PfkB family carbohydrate kinase [Polyangiaceae bacterium]